MRSGEQPRHSQSLADRAEVWGQKHSSKTLFSNPPMKPQHVTQSLNTGSAQHSTSTSTNLVISSLIYKHICCPNIRRLVTRSLGTHFFLHITYVHFINCITLALHLMRVESFSA